jgi:predicted ATPase
MKIVEFSIKNYRVFRDAQLRDVPDLCVLVGANGSGKSTLFDVFSFLKDALTMNVSKALMRRGGFSEVVTRGSEGPIEIEVKFRESGGRLATYTLRISSENSKGIVEREVLKFRRGQRGQPWHFLDFTRGKGMAITNEEDYGKEQAQAQREEQTLESQDILAIKGLGQFQRFRIVSEFRRMIENWHISDFHIQDARPSAEEGLSEHLSTQGENLSLVAQFLHDHHPEVFATILQRMKERVPGVQSVEARPTEDGRIVLRFQDGAFKDPFIARYVSDGTIKMFAYLVLLYDPTTFPLLTVEEPENQLYPELLRELCEEFRQYAERGGQVFVSTHSPDFLNAVRLDEIYWLRKREGIAEVCKASESELLRNLVAEGDLPGALWRQGLFEGAGPRS